MLKMITENSVNRWTVNCKYLLEQGIRSPQGFSFDFGSDDNYFWTTSEFAAYAFFKRVKIADDVTTEYFSKRLEKEQYLHSLSSVITSNIELASPLNLKYREYQLPAIEYGLLVDNLLIADEQRIGKTITALGILNNLEEWNKVLVICPKTAKSVWLEESEKWLLHKPKIQVITSQSGIDLSADVYIINYDILFIHNILNTLKHIPFDIIIGDEIHKCKNLDKRRSRALCSLTAKKKMGLSGTPLLNKPVDLLSVCQWLDDSWKEFSVKRGAYVNQKSGISFPLEEVQDILRSTMMVRRVQAQVFDNEPMEERIITLETPNELKPLVHVELNGKKNLNSIEEYTQARKLLGLNKVNYAINHINTYTSQGEKMVVFARHREVLERIASSLGTRAELIYGDTTDAGRKFARDRFRDDSSCTVIVGSIDSMGEAIPLSVSHHILFVEMDWSGGKMGQAKERCSDKNQEYTVLIEYLTYENSLDFYILENINFKTETANIAIDI